MKSAAVNPEFNQVEVWPHSSPTDASAPLGSSAQGLAAAAAARRLAANRPITLAEGPRIGPFQIFSGS